MVRSGIGHARTAIVWYLVMATGIMLAFWALGLSPLSQWSVVAAWAAVLVVVGAMIDARWRRHESGLSEQP
jgi:membrane protein YdbS with pleckstrin-like domain